MVVPFLVLSFQGSIEVWSRLYYFAIIGVGLAVLFFASPAKGFLRKNIELRQAKGRFSAQRPSISRSASTDSLASGHHMLGVSPDLERDVTEMVEEIKADIEVKRRATQKKE